MSNTIKDNASASLISKSFTIRLHRTSRKASTPTQHHDAKTGKEQLLQNVLYDFSMGLHNFAEIMVSLLRYGKQVGDLAKNTQKIRHVELFNTIKSVVEESNTKRKRDKPLFELEITMLQDQPPAKQPKKVFPIWNVDHVRLLSELEDAEGVAPRILCETMLQQIVNRWETHLANIIRTLYASDANLLTESINVTFRQLASCGDLQSIQRLFVDQVVSAAMGGGIEEHLRYLKEDNAFGIDFEQYFPKLPALKEVMYHRDIIVHCDGIASPRFCKKMKGICKAREAPKQGERVRTDLPYVFGAWDVVYAAGCVLSYLISAKIMANMRRDKIDDLMGRVLVEASFNALLEQRYAATQIMIEPLLQCSDKMEVSVQLALKVNLALAYKYSGQGKKFKSIIDDRDWDSRDEQFRAIIAALRGDFKSAYCLIKKICKDDPSYLNSVYEWVAYAELREDKDFQKQMAKIRASKSFVPHKGYFPILELGAPPENIHKRFQDFLSNLFDSKAKSNV